jgi:hypothetical protein
VVPDTCYSPTRHEGGSILTWDAHTSLRADMISCFCNPLARLGMAVCDQSLCSFVDHASRYAYANVWLRRPAHLHCSTSLPVTRVNQPVQSSDGRPMSTSRKAPMCQDFLSYSSVWRYEVADARVRRSAHTSCAWFRRALPMQCDTSAEGYL